MTRGELPPDLDLELAADLIVGPIAVRIFFSGRKLKPKVAARIPLAEAARAHELLESGRYAGKVVLITRE